MKGSSIYTCSPRPHHAGVRDAPTTLDSGTPPPHWTPGRLGRPRHTGLRDARDARDARATASATLTAGSAGCLGTEPTAPSLPSATRMSNSSERRSHGLLPLPTLALRGHQEMAGERYLLVAVSTSGGPQRTAL
ncbi:unnamed protein product [Rangifer tarandus platyrhynchus]|uniref:Uncharacterized protein n=1 Tax=Rangifer tarandus platyrhynchus TaxID=3082113 RepID=A0AC60A5Q8_RANTA